MRGAYNLELFQPVDAIKKKNLPDQLHFIFLEGLPGAGKSDILQRLQKVSLHPFPFFTPFLKMGFTTYADLFRTTITEKGPISPIQTLLWTTRMIDAVNNFNTQFKGL